LREPETSANETPEVADRRQLVLSVATPLCLRTRVAGLFLFWPLWARLGFDEVVPKAGYAGSRMVPADAALLSLLTLKLLDKERRSHIDDFNFEAAVGLFAGLNILPKKSFATDSSYRAGPDQQRRLLAGWVKRLAPWLWPEANAFSWDFHPIPYRGDEAVLENHSIPGRGTAHASVPSCFAQEYDSRMFCYANANLIRDEQPAEVLRFVEFWHDLTGHDPEWLYFDSKLTTYAELSRLNQRGVHFVTIRRRGARLVQKILDRPAGDWTSAVIDIPKRRQKRPVPGTTRSITRLRGGGAADRGDRLGARRTDAVLDEPLRGSSAGLDHELRSAESDRGRTGHECEFLPPRLLIQRGAFECGPGRDRDRDRQWLLSLVGRPTEGLRQDEAQAVVSQIRGDRWSDRGGRESHAADHLRPPETGLEPARAWLAH
jgi:hypothetical protein